MSAIEYIIASERQKTLLRSDKENHWQIDYLEIAQSELQKYQNNEAELAQLRADNTRLQKAVDEATSLITLLVGVQRATWWLKEYGSQKETI
jgi:DNA repair ATPase RecN